MTTPAPCSNPNCDSATSAEWWNHRTGERVCFQCVMRGYACSALAPDMVTPTYEATRQSDCNRARFDALAFTILVRTTQSLP